MASEFSPALYRAGEGEPLVLVHGFTATWRCWLPVLSFLVPRFEVIAPTLHGHDGGPPAPHTADSISDAADHFELLLDDLGVGDAHFAGNSMGGALSLEMAKRGRARSVIAISPGGGWEHFRTSIPGVRFKAMPGLGHTPMWDDAAQIAQAIADFAEAAQAAASPASSSPAAV
jgi:pimeloyl-ACP methyl ester carboxylesterase